MKTSKRFSLNAFDWIKGVGFAAGTAILDTLIEWGGKGEINWQNVLYAGISAALVYLKVKFFTPSKNVTPAQ